MRQHFIYTLLLLALLGCEDSFEEFDREDDFKGTETVKGRITYKDLYAGDGQEKPLAGKKVYLAYAPSDTASYLYYTLTDGNGNFAFSRLYHNKEYALFTRDTMGGVLYTSFYKVTPAGNEIDMVATNDSVKQNGLFITVVDEQQPFNGATINVFVNEQLFLADSSAGSIDTKTTDASGRVIFYNLPKGTYYFRVRGRAGNTLFRADTSLTYPARGFTPMTITVRPTPVVKNGIEVRTLDEQGNVLPNAGVCLFNNRTLFLSDTCLGSIDNGNTDNAGRKNFYDLSPGRYYLLSTVRYNNTVYRAADSVEVTEQGIKAVPLVLKGSPEVRNESEITVLDVFDTPVYQTQLCLFNSRVLFAADTCLGNIDQKNTGINGKAIFTNLSAGKYYIRARAQFGDLILKGADSIEVSNTGKIFKTIKVQ